MHTELVSIGVHITVFILIILVLLLVTLHYITLKLFWVAPQVNTAKPLVCFITVMFHLGYLISPTHLCFTAFLSMYIVLIDVLIYSAAAV